MDAARIRVYPRLIVALYGVAAIGYALSFHDQLDVSGKPIGSDFMAFYVAGKLALAGRGAEAFDLETFLRVQHQLFPNVSGGGYGWFYPPPFLLVVAPLALLPYFVALAAWLAGTATAWAVTLRRAIGRPGAGWLMAAFPGLWMCVLQGQNGMLTSTLAAGSILLHRRRPALSGILLGLLVVKPHLAVLFAVALMATRAWRTMAVAAATALLVLGASVAVFGPAALTGWLDGLQLARVSTELGLLPWSKMPSMFAALRVLGAPVAWAYAGHAVVALGAGVAVWLVWRRSPSLGLRGAVLMAGTFLANPYAFDYDLVWLAFPIAWLALHGLEAGWRRGDREVLLAAWVLPAFATAMATVAHLQVAPVVLAAVVWIALRRAVRVGVLTGLPRPVGLSSSSASPRPAAALRRWSRRG